MRESFLKEYVVCDPVPQSLAGRAWSVAELRRKNFRDLHIIWYQCQRELNVLRTVDYNYKRWRIRQQGATTELRAKMHMVRDRYCLFLNK